MNQLDPEGRREFSIASLNINRDMRQRNNQLAKMRHETEPKVLWHGPFYRLGKVESLFADERTYIYQGAKESTSRCTWASTCDVQPMPVKAANAGA